MANGVIHVPDREWTLLGTSSSSSQKVTYPEGAREILVKAMSTASAEPAYFTILPVAAIQDVKMPMIGGYYYGASDTGLANLNHDAANRTLAFRNLRYGSYTAGTFTFWCR